MTNTIPITALKKFKPLANQIKPNALLPICSYLLLDFHAGSCRITKNSMNSFVVHTIESATGEGKFLIDEKILWSSVDFASTQELTISLAGKSVLLNNGREKKSATEDYNLFPANDTPSSDIFPISSEILDELQTTNNFIIEEEIPTPRSFIFTGSDWIAGSNGNIFYAVVAKGINNMVLRKEVVSAIVSLGSCNHSFNKSYDFFSTQQTTMGFVKSDYNWYDMTPICKYNQENGISLNKQILINFNSEAIASAKANDLTAQFVIDDNKMHLQAQEISHNMDLSHSFSVAGVSSIFKYNPTLMNTLLKSIPGDEIILYAHGATKFYITDAANTFVSMIMGMQ